MPVPRPGPPRDPSLPHQVVLSAGGSRNNNITVSCNCRHIPNQVFRVTNNEHYEPIGEVSNFEQTKRLYNDPANHRGPVPFTVEWELGHVEWVTL